MRILLATDGSEFSEGAARYLSRFDLSSRDEVIVLHVVTSIPFDDDARGRIMHVIRRVSPAIRKTALNILGGTEAKVSSREEEGAPDEVIVGTAQEAGADLIVMGARGLRGMKSLFIGSVTRAVAAVSQIPLIVTKPYAVQDQAMRVLFATDGSATAAATARLLSSIPFPKGTELKILTVSSAGVGDIPERYALEIQEQMKSYVAEIRRRSSEEAGKVLDAARMVLSGKFMACTEVARTGDPAAEILKEAEAWQADLVAVGSRGLRGIKGMLGSVSRRVLGLSPCPVLIGKKPQTVQTLTLQS